MDWPAAVSNHLGIDGNRKRPAETQPDITAEKRERDGAHQRGAMEERDAPGIKTPTNRIPATGRTRPLSRRYHPNLTIEFRVPRRWATANDGGGDFLKGENDGETTTKAIGTHREF